MRFTEMQRTIYILHRKAKMHPNIRAKLALAVSSTSARIYASRSIARYHRRKSITLLRLVHRVSSYYSTFSLFYFVFIIIFYTYTPHEETADVYAIVCPARYAMDISSKKKRSVWKFVFKYFGLSSGSFEYRISHIYEISLICFDSNERETNELNEN